MKGVKIMEVKGKDISEELLKLWNGQRAEELLKVNRS